MNDKSKDTTKARQDLKNLGIRKKSFCQFIKGVKLPDVFGSNFKHKVTDNDSNITGLKSHDCHIMMQLLLPYGLQHYLPSSVATPIIKLCSFFKQICSRTLMEADMVKAQIHVIDILCNLEIIYPPAFFDVMIHLVIHLPQEALEGGPIPNRWMYPFERYMKKLKNYDVTMKFNRPGRNVDCPPQHIHKRYIDKDPDVSASGELFALAVSTNRLQSRQLWYQQ
ncbi:hypothetical protein Tco_1216370 [Tanacetum coccineum]